MPHQCPICNASEAYSTDKDRCSRGGYHSSLVKFNCKHPDITTEQKCNVCYFTAEVKKLITIDPLTFEVTPLEGTLNDGYRWKFTEKDEYTLESCPPIDVVNLKFHIFKNKRLVSNISINAKHHRGTNPHYVSETAVAH